MLKKIIKKALRFLFEKNTPKTEKNQEKIKSKFFGNGQIPWTEGYHEHKMESISKSIIDDSLLNQFIKKSIPESFGYRIDERIVEYPWIFSKLNRSGTVFLDAGSTFNFDYLLDTKIIENKSKYIYTFHPESNNYNDRKVSYIYGDLRDLPFKDEFFEEIVCQSTIEHIDMDNTIYGYEKESTLNDISTKSYEYLKVIYELLRVLKTNGQLLLTFPFGEFENHGFFQQFDDEMLQRIVDIIEGFGSFEIDYFKYEMSGWRFARKNELAQVKSYNPHTGKGKSDDGVAHCRSIACVKLIKQD